MRKCIFLVLLFALVGLATSCSQDDVTELQNNVNNRVTIRVGVETDNMVMKSGTLTRASGALQLDGYSLRYILEVWNDDDVVAYREEKLVTDASQAVDFEFSLPDAGDYNALLWADYITEGATETDGHYTDLYYTTNSVNGLGAVSIIGSAYTVNAGSRDAFFGTSSFTKTAGTAANLGSITLNRPFGRLNIIEKDANLQADLTSMSLSYTVPQTFNTLTGGVSGTYNVVVSDITSFPSAATEKANLFFDYIFTPATGQQLLGEIAIEYRLATATGAFNIPANMPVERNKRTNISGNILTDPDITRLSVEIDDTWTDGDIEKNPQIDDIIQVGSYYYEGGYISSQFTTSLTCMGIIFIVDETGEHGKIVSTDEASKAWSTEKVVTNAKNIDDGMANMVIIQQISGWQTKYPAFAWCANKGTGWYLPAENEMRALGDAMTNINTALNRIPGADNLKTSDEETVAYFTSTEYYQETQRDVDCGSAFMLSTSNSIATNFLKDEIILVRAIKDF